MDDPINMEKETENVRGRTALLTDIVVIRILKFLSLEDIKNCRLVCLKWNSLSKSFITRQSRVIFENIKPSRFLHEVENSFPDLVIHAFQFLNSQTNKRWSTSELDNFFEKWGSNVRFLQLFQLILENDHKHELRKYDITPWIEASHICELNITCGRSKTEFSVPLYKLVSVKSISLAHCAISVRQGYIIAPLKLYFYDNNFYQGGKLLPELNVNEFLDISKMIELSISRMFGTTVPIIDFGGQVLNHHTITLRKTNVINWDKAKGSVKDVTIIGSPLVGRNQLQIKEFYFDPSRMHFSILPSTIEKMFVFVAQSGAFSDTPVINLPNLTSLSITFVTDLEILPYFVNCTNLTEIFLHGLHRCRDQLILNVDCIPKSVKRMEISADIKFIGDEYLIVDTLVLLDYSMLDAQDVISKIQPEALIISWHKKNETTDDIFSFVVANNHLTKLVIGICNYHSNSEFETGRLSSIVDKKSNYYEFRNQIGTTITPEEFEKLTDMSSHSS